MNQNSEGNGMWYVISEYADSGDYEIVANGTEDEAVSFFKSQLSSELKMSDADVRNITAYQFEIWVKQHYQKDMKPDLAYTVKLTDSLPSEKRH